MTEDVQDAQVPRRPESGQEEKEEREKISEENAKKATNLILKSLERDQDKLLNPRILPFSSLNNAYDSLLPYHLFMSPTYDDLIYQTVKRAKEPKNMERVLEKLAEIVLGTKNEPDELHVMEERLRVEEERYYLNKTINYRKTKIKEIEETVLRPSR